MCLSDHLFYKDHERNIKNEGLTLRVLRLGWNLNILGCRVPLFWYVNRRFTISTKKSINEQQFWHLIVSRSSDLLSSVHRRQPWTCFLTVDRVCTVFRSRRLYSTTSYNIATFSSQSQVKINDKNDKKQINEINKTIKIEKDRSFKSGR